MQTKKQYKKAVQKHSTKKQYKKAVQKSSTKKTVQKGSGKPLKINNYNDSLHIYTLAECVKELIEASYNLYNEILTKGIPSTIICGGQSPSYYCLAMMTFKIFNPDIVNIVIMPHSKGGVRSDNQLSENRKYCERIKEKFKEGEIRQSAIIIDGVHTGVGILALERALKSCIPNINITKIAINASSDVREIPVDKELILLCEPLFSDTFPRLVVPFYTREFHNSSKFITQFINIETNPIAQMIIDIAKEYPEVKVEDTEWFKLNNEITAKIAKEKENAAKKKIENAKKQQIIESKKKQYKIDEKHFIPIILENPKRYKCPICDTKTGTLAPENPSNTRLFAHALWCPFKGKIPVEKELNSI